MTKSTSLINFLSKKITHRRKSASLKKELLVKALGLNRKSSPPHIIDATAGLGQDSFIVASLGFEITLLERSPVIYAFLQEALLAAKQEAELVPVINRMHLIHADSIHYLTALKPEERPDIIYLDPMFPERKKSALNKKEMRVLHDTVGDDPDAGQLLAAALACAKKRVVVKRPRLADVMAGLKPTYQLTGRSNRFDIYLIMAGT